MSHGIASNFEYRQPAALSRHEDALLAFELTSPTARQCRAANVEHVSTVADPDGWFRWVHFRHAGHSIVSSARFPTFEAAAEAADTVTACAGCIYAEEK